MPARELRPLSQADPHGLLWTAVTGEEQEDKGFNTKKTWPETVNVQKNGGLLCPQEKYNTKLYLFLLELSWESLCHSTD